MNLRDGRAVLLAGIVLHILFIGSLFGQYLNPLFAEAERSFGQAADYFGIYTAGEDLVHGRSIYSGFEDPGDAARRVPYFYFFRYLPPTAYFSALTTLIMSPMAGYVLWVVLTELMLGLILRSILRLESYPARERRLHAGLWLGFFPFYLEQWMGQFSFLMALFLWIMLRRATEDRAAGRDGWITDGGSTARTLSFWAWACSVVLKSYTVLFAISYFRRRQYRPVFLCAGVVLLACTPYWIAHPSDIEQFLLLNLRPLPPNIHGGTLGASALIRLLGWTLPADLAGRRIALGGHDVSWGNIPVLASGFLIFAVALWVVLRHGRKIPLDLQIGLWVLCFFLIFKDVWEYHYVMLLPVITAIALEYRSRFVLWMGLLLAAPTPHALFAGPDHTITGVLNLIHHASKALPTLALFIWIVGRCLGGQDGQGAGLAGARARSEGRFS